MARAAIRLVRCGRARPPAPKPQYGAGGGNRQRQKVDEMEDGERASPAGPYGQTVAGLLVDEPGERTGQESEPGGAFEVAHRRYCLRVGHGLTRGAERGRA